MKKIPTNIIYHPIWPEIKPHLDIRHNNAPGGWRINILNTIPIGVARRALKVRVACAREGCGKMIHPIRQSGTWYNIYYSSSCPQTKSLRCSRSSGAKNSCAMVRKASLD